MTGDKTQGKKCGQCFETEARCAYLTGCCGACTHWRNWTVDGEPINHDQVVDEVTARRRAKDRERYARRRTSVGATTTEGEAVRLAPTGQIRGRGKAAAADIDETAVVRVMRGEQVEALTSWERRTAIGRLRGLGLTYTQIAQRVAVHPAQVHRDLRRLGLVHRSDFGEAS